MIQKGSILDQGPGQLGGRATLSPTAVVDTVLRLEAEDKTKPTVFTLNLDCKIARADLAAAVPAGSNHLVVAEVKWGSIKGRGRALVDVKHGVKMTLEGSILAVDVFYLQANVGLAFAGPTVEVFASIGEGSEGVSGGPPVTLTLNSRLVVAAANTVWLIPDYAYAVEIHNNADPTAGVPNGFLVQVQGDPSVGGPARILNQFAGPLTPITLPNGAEALVLTNAGPGDMTYTPVFYLDI